MEINEHQAKLSGKCNLLSGLENGKTYDLTISEAEVRKIEEVPNDDGTYNRVATIRINELSELNVISEKEVVKSKSKKSQSQILRWKIEQRWEEIGDGEKEDFYVKEMTRIINEYRS